MLLLVFSNKYSVAYSPLQPVNALCLVWSPSDRSALVHDGVPGLDRYHNRGPIRHGSFLDSLRTLETLARLYSSDDIN